MFDTDYVGKLAGKQDQNVERGLELLKGLFGLDFLTTHHFPTHVIKRVPANSQKRKLEVSTDGLCKVQKLVAEARGASSTATLNDLVSALADMSPHEFGVDKDQGAGHQRDEEQPQAMGAAVAAGAGSGAGEGGAEGAGGARGGAASVAAGRVTRSTRSGGV